MGAVAVDLLFFGAAGIDRISLIGNQSRPAVYKRESKKKIILLFPVDVYAA